MRRGRDLGLPFPGTPGAHNAITDVAGVEVGTVTLISGEGPLDPGRGPVRTGVMDWLPNDSLDPLFNATVEAVEEAVIDAMLVNETMVGRDGTRSIALPHDEIVALMRAAGRL